MSILIIVAHSDDETIGMGGTIAKHVSEGEKVFGIHLTDGVSSRTQVKKAAKERTKAADLAAMELGMEWIGRVNFPDNALEYFGSATNSTSEKKFGNKSLYFDGTWGSLRQETLSSDFDLSDQDFTIDFCVRVNSLNNPGDDKVLIGN